MALRRDEVLDTAMTLLGEQGSRALTHRAVDRAADLPEGTASNYFRTRDALIAGILERLTHAEAEAMAALRFRRPSAGSVGAVAELGAEMIRFMLGPGRTLTLARHALFLEASWRPELRPALVRASQTWWTATADLLAATGSPEPERHGRWLLAYIDGLLADQLCRPDPAFDPEAAIAAAVRGMVGPG